MANKFKFGAIFIIAAVAVAALSAFFQPPPPTAVPTPPQPSTDNPPSPPPALRPATVNPRSHPPTSPLTTRKRTPAAYRLPSPPTDELIALPPPSPSALAIFFPSPAAPMWYLPAEILQNIYLRLSVSDRIKMLGLNTNSRVGLRDEYGFRLHDTVGRLVKRGFRVIHSDGLWHVCCLVKKVNEIGVRQILIVNEKTGFLISAPVYQFIGGRDDVRGFLERPFYVKLVMKDDGSPSVILLSYTPFSSPSLATEEAGGPLLGGRLVLKANLDEPDPKWVDTLE